MKNTAIPVKLFPGEAKPNSTVFVLGATGSGKTVLMANELLRRPRFLVLDTRDEYPQSFFPGSVVVGSLRELVTELNKGSAWIIYRVPLVHDDEDGQSISQPLLIARDFQLANQHKPPLTVSLDEFNKYSSPSYMPIGIKEVVERGRGLKIQKIFGAQWFNAIPASVRDTFTEIYVYRHTEKRGLLKLEELGFNIADVANLPPYEVLHLKGGIISRHKVQATNNGA